MKRQNGETWGQDIRRSEHQGIREPVYQGTLETRRQGEERSGDKVTGRPGRKRKF